MSRAPKSYAIIQASRPIQLHASDTRYLLNNDLRLISAIRTPHIRSVSEFCVLVQEKLNI
jgi:hypothetical protein